MLEEVPGVPLQGPRGVARGRLDEAGVDVGLQQEREEDIGGHPGSSRVDVKLELRSSVSVDPQDPE